MKNIIIVFSIALLIAGCGGAGDSSKGADTINTPKGDDINNQPNVNANLPESLRGEWMYVHSAELIYIDETFPYAITSKSPTLISTTQGGNIYYLMRSGIDTTTLNGSLYTQNSVTPSPARGYGNIGSLDVILEHVIDKKNKKEKKLNNTGDFTFENVKSGDYELTATTDTNLTVKAEVDVHGEEVTLGNFKLVLEDGYNFKTEFVIDNAENGYFYGNQQVYTGKFIVHNIGSKRGTGLNYSFSTDSGYVANYSNVNVLGSVEVGSSLEIDFQISFNVIDAAKKTIPLEVTIRDAYNNEWVDTIFFHVYQTPLDINIATSSSSVKGYVIAPGNQLIPIDMSNGTLRIPYRAGKKYTLVLSNPSIDTETAYSIGIDTSTESFITFNQTSAHEPNNIESEAKTIHVGESIISYLHVGDIDYFTIDMSSDEDVGITTPPQVPFQ